MSVVVARAFFVHAPKIVHTSVDVDSSGCEASENI